MKSEENSALVALAELRSLEDDRAAEEQMRRTAEAQARHLAALEAERREREEALRLRREEEEAVARAQAEADARAREEQARLREIEMRARLEQEDRLRREQLRLEAQMRLENQMRTTESTAAPRWPYAVVPMLVAAVAIAGTLAWRGAADAERQETLAERESRQQSEQIAMISAKLDELEDEQARLERERADLVVQLNAASTGAERERLQEQQAELDAKIAESTSARGGKSGASKPSGKRPTAKPAKPKDVETATKPSRPPIVIDDTSDPLAGLGAP